MKTKVASRLLPAALLVLGAALPSAADPPPHAKGGHGKGGASSTADVRVEIGGTLVRAGISVEYARGLAVRHGVTGYGELPPGIRKNLMRGKPLPPGIAKRGVPAAVLAELPRYPGYEWQVLGSDLVLVALAGAVIADVLLGVFD